MTVLPCPRKGCDGRMHVSAEMLAEMPTWGMCICGQTRVALIPDEDGAPTLARLVDKPLRKGDQVLVRHTYTGISGGGGEWHSVESVGRGGKKPRYANGGPIDMSSVVGALEEVP